MRSLSIVYEAHVSRMPYLGNWQFYVRDSGLDWHFDLSNVISQWKDSASIHSSEQAVAYIHYLESFLMTQSNRFSDTATIEDTNTAYHEVYPSWQYPAKEPWTFSKEDLMQRAHV
jgi:hypothetical protein